MTLLTDPGPITGALIAGSAILGAYALLAGHGERIQAWLTRRHEAREHARHRDMQRAMWRRRRHGGQR